MAYTINLTDGSIFAVIPDGTINTSSSMTLIGKNYAGYGDFLDENFIHLLENGSNTTAPGAPLTGQLWWDKTNNLLKVYNGTTFKTISAATASSTAPTSNVTGDLWYDTTNQLLKVWTGSAFLTVGPSTVAGTGVQATTIVDNTSTSHPVVQFTIDNDVIAILSQDSAFTPQSSITGWGSGQQVKPGLNLSTAAAYLFQGSATDAQLLDGLDSTQFLRANVNATTSGTLGVLNDTGFTVGADNDFKANVSGTTVFLSNQTTNGNLIITVNQAGVPANVISINGSTGFVTIPNLVGNIAANVSNIIATGNVTGGNLITSGVVTATGNITGANIICGNIFNSNANGVGNIGTASTYFNTIFATATRAQYADVAERFAADAVYEAGTVVELGGTAEITCSRLELSDSVFGVISTRAAYLMNDGAGSDATHPPVAMTGRVPVRVVGQVAKGDRLVSAGNGLARAARAGEATAFNVIGRSLVAKTDLAEGTVEAIVTIK